MKTKRVYFYKMMSRGLASFNFFLNSSDYWDELGFVSEDREGFRGLW